MSAAPILGFICPQCHHGMRSVCDACEEREQIEAGEQASFEQSAQQQAYNTRLAEMRTIPGYQALEDDLEAHLYTLATVLGEADADEDGPITKALRAAADGLDGRQTVALDDGDRAMIFDALEGHARRLAVVGQIERSQAVHALLVRLGKGAS